ncbi:polysaccharide biosynthesis/export family protein [Pedobacter sp. P26]|uniref:polysaccharide biosynthesis/export family protein n=1 Tax=Pedobacter sp. P26 TaxID=3423956 RepID=UPI003D669A05
MKKILSVIKLACIAWIIVPLLTGCVSTKNVPYFQDISSAETSVIPNVSTFKEPTIQPDDILSISIFTIDPTTSMVINQIGTQSLALNQATNASNSGFLVDKNGEIELSVIGKVKLLGLTTFQARDLIYAKAALSYKDPNVQVRYANFKITVLGEVKSPATYTVPNEKVTVLDALGMAGDLTIYGKRENVLLVRDNNGEKQFARLNLNSADLFKSSFYYLKQNDVLYIEPNKGKAASLNTARAQTITLVGTALTVIIALISRL